jgi:hypothetical protein
MIDRRPAPPARLLVSVGALTVVGVPAYLAVVHGSTIDVGAFVYAVPIAAIAFAIVASIGYALVGTRALARPAGSFTSGARRYGGGFGRSPRAQLIVGALGLLVLGTVFLFTDADARVYASDPTCAGTQAAGGACSEQDVWVSGAWTTSGRGGSHPHVRVALPDGRNVAMTLAGSNAWAVYDAARQPGARDATVQWYHGRIVALSDSAGRSATDGMPARRRDGIFITALVFAAIGLIGAVRSLIAPSV